MKTIVLIVALLSLISCSNQGEKKQEIKNNGVDINYTISGTGEKTLFFVHGWCIDQNYWNSQVSFFNKNYKVVTVDLPGHGESGKNRDSWKVSDYASDVVKVIDDLQLKHVILVGHSMGGDIVLEAALARPDVVDAIIGVDNFKDVGVQPDEQTRQAIGQFFDMLEADYSNTAASYANEYL
ncbi:MAG: alpha/beta hydrolase, partial [Cyclobacteriaceae bacterium]|nr:alpha/beta hydrolase [Cyclobacteriaceae bacterium]